MHSPLYRRIFPQTRISSRKDTEAEIMTTAGGWRLTISVGGTLTGRGGDLLIIDNGQPDTVDLVMTDQAMSVTSSLWAAKPEKTRLATSWFEAALHAACNRRRR